MKLKKVIRKMAESTRTNPQDKERQIQTGDDTTTCIVKLNPNLKSTK